jgi:hypothetical protein
MAFRRTIAPATRPDAEQLTADLIGIGMLFAGRGNSDANIEDTLLFASEAGMDGEDFRTLAVLSTWLSVHAAFVNADRLTKLVRSYTSPRVRLYWAAVARWHSKDNRFARLRKAHRGPPQDLLSVGQEFQIRRFGEDPRFAGGPLRADAKILRDRPADVLTPVELARRHSTYRWRLIIGPSYRADLWAALERNPDLTVTELARRSYSSIGAAWETRQSWRLLNSNTGTEHAPRRMMLPGARVRIPG